MVVLNFFLKEHHRWCGDSISEIIPKKKPPRVRGSVRSPKNGGAYLNRTYLGTPPDKKEVGGMMGVKTPESAALPPHILSFSSSVSLAQSSSPKSKKEEQEELTQAG